MPAFATRYQAFIDACFVTFTGPGEDAKLRTFADVQRHERRAWSDEWDRLFATGEESPSEEVEHAYRAVMDEFGAEVGTRRDQEAA